MIYGVLVFVITTNTHTHDCRYILLAIWYSVKLCVVCSGRLHGVYALFRPTSPTTPHTSIIGCTNVPSSLYGSTTRRESDMMYGSCRYTITIAAWKIRRIKGLSMNSRHPSPAQRYASRSVIFWVGPSYRYRRSCPSMSSAWIDTAECHTIGCVTTYLSALTRISLLAHSCVITRCCQNTASPAPSQSISPTSQGLRFASTSRRLGVVSLQPSTGDSVFPRHHANTLRLLPNRDARRSPQLLHPPLPPQRRRQWHHQFRPLGVGPTFVADVKGIIPFTNMRTMRPRTQTSTSLLPSTSVITGGWSQSTLASPPVRLRCSIIVPMRLRLRCPIILTPVRLSIICTRRMDWTIIASVIRITTRDPSNCGCPTWPICSHTLVNVRPTSHRFSASQTICVPIPTSSILWSHASICTKPEQSWCPRMSARIRGTKVVQAIRLSAVST